MCMIFFSINITVLFVGDKYTKLSAIIAPLAAIIFTFFLNIRAVFRIIGSGRTGADRQTAAVTGFAETIGRNVETVGRNVEMVSRNAGAIANRPVADGNSTTAAVRTLRSYRPKQKTQEMNR